MRQLRELRGVGRAMLEDFAMLNVATVEQLAGADPDDLYERLVHLRGVPIDICCLDTFRCAVAQARNPRLPAEQCDWWWWSRQRKADAL